MKNSIILMILCFSSTVMAQDEINERRNFSLEFAFGVNKVGVWESLDFELDITNIETPCVGCQVDYLQDYGSEDYMRLSMQWSPKQKHYFTGGVGYHAWTYTVTRVEGLEPLPIADRFNVTRGLEQYLNFLNLMVGYRYSFLEWRGILFFLEAELHEEINMTRVKNSYRFSVEPGLGINLGLSDRLSIFSVTNYTWIVQNSFGRDVSHIGLRAGLNFNF